MAVYDIHGYYLNSFGTAKRKKDFVWSGRYGRTSAGYFPGAVVYRLIFKMAIRSHKQKYSIVLHDTSSCIYDLYFFLLFPGKHLSR